jgi:hypothetical protein
VQYADGDGSVPLLSMGFMCERGWPESRAHNPALAPDKFVVREYDHDPDHNINVRDIHWLAQGGTTTADHVNILGNTELLQDILRIVTMAARPTDAAEKQYEAEPDRPLPTEAEWLPERRVLSDLPQMAARVQWPPQEDLRITP